MASRFASRNCPECGVEFIPTLTRGKQQHFCCVEHKTAHAARRTARGKALVAIAQGWRQTRGSGDLGKFLFSEMQQMLDQWNAEDREAGRMRADDYAKKVCGYEEVNPAYYDAPFTATRFIDRKVHRPTAKQEA